MKKHSLKQLHSFLLLWGSQTVSQLGTAMTDYAVIIWVYGRRGTASSVTLLTVYTFLPTIFFRFLAGSIVDRRNKKRIMLIADLLAACGTLAVFTLHSADVLQIWHRTVYRRRCPALRRDPRTCRNLQLRNSLKQRL